MYIFKIFTQNDHPDHFTEKSEDSVQLNMEFEPLTSSREVSGMLGSSSSESPSSLSLCNSPSPSSVGFSHL